MVIHKTLIQEVEHVSVKKSERRPVTLKCKGMKTEIKGRASKAKDYQNNQTSLL